MYSSTETEFEVQRTIDRAELTALFCHLKKVIGPIKVQFHKKRIIDGLWRGERKCIGPKAGDADLWTEIWEELHNLAAEDILVEVEHLKAKRTKNDKKEMSHFESLLPMVMRKRMSWQKTGARRLEQKSRISKEWKWQRGTVVHPLSESQWNRDHFSMILWESEKHESCGIPAEGFKGRFATDGSLLGAARKW